MQVVELLRSVFDKALIVVVIFTAMTLRAVAAKPLLTVPSSTESNSTLRLADAAKPPLPPQLPVPPQVPAASPLPIPPQDPAATPDYDNSTIEQPDTLPQLFPPEIPPQAPGQRSSASYLAPPEPASLDELAHESDAESSNCPPTEMQSDRFHAFGLRHSSTDGRNAGMGLPLVGTSWLNRPYYFGVDLGTVWVSRPPQGDVSDDIDTYGGVYLGYDWDYYWGSELAVQRATPELKNETQPWVPRGDRLMIWTASMMYYPWGDTYYRPYWRLGIGGTEIDYPLDSGSRNDEDLWTIPIGIGIKYPVRHWLAARAEFTDELGLGNTGVNTQHNLTLTFALEWRFGAKPKSYWPWNPGRHVW